MKTLIPFYEVTTALCFALLGFWWIVVQLRHDEFTNDRRLRAIAYSVSLSFVIPGLMSLTALLAVENNAMWRIGFGFAATVGAAHAIYLFVTQRERRMWLLLGRLATIALYVLVAIVAVRPQLPADLGFDVSGLAVEGALVATFIFLGVNMAWSYFMRPATDALS